MFLFSILLYCNGLFEYAIINVHVKSESIELSIVT
jgi:hypothetical protein